MPLCRIYLFTYKRNHLLPRAVQSLVDQTFGDWVCEVHNDDPGDEFPEKFITSLNDDRFIIRNHPVNLGATISFNLAFGGCEEKYAAILEDDNWWESSFLKELVNIMDANSTLHIAWSNMRIWNEKIGNKWEYTGKTTWSVENNNTFFNWPGNKHALGAVHSNGAMMYKGDSAKNYAVPDNCDFNAMEAIRERTFKFPIYLTTAPLANFSQTLNTSRSGDILSWTGCQVMLLSSYIEAAPGKEETFKNTLVFFRDRKPSPVVTFFLSVFFIIKKPRLIKYFTLNDWFIISKWLIKNAYTYFRLNRYLSSQQNVYDFLLEKTQLRYAESKEKP